MLCIYAKKLNIRFFIKIKTKNLVKDIKIFEMKLKIDKKHQNFRKKEKNLWKSVLICKIRVPKWFHLKNSIAFHIFSSFFFISQKKIINLQHKKINQFFTLYFLHYFQIYPNYTFQI